MRDFLAVIFLFFVFGWFVFVVYLHVCIGIEGWGQTVVDVASGVFLACFKDMWQFFFRKKES